MARVIDRLITIFPFEAAHFDGTGLKVDYVGHPLVDEAAAVIKEPAALLPWSGWPRVALLPGSRAHVIDRMLPVMWKAAGLLAAKYPGASFIIPAPSPSVAAIVRARLAKLKAGGPAHIDVVVGQTRQVLRQSGAAWVASGTATVETALMMCPMVVAYRMAPLSYLMGRILVTLDHIAMVNIIAGRRICPEFIQGAATPEKLADAVDPLLDDSPQRDEMLRGLEEVVRSLGGGGAAARAAKVIVDCMGCDSRPGL
jgi:lipid-A-disaccharide synthase